MTDFTVYSEPNEVKAMVEEAEKAPEVTESPEVVVSEETQAPEGFEVVAEGMDDMPASDTVPLRSHLKQKQKWKEQKAEFTKSTEALKAENDLLRMQLEQQNQTAPEMPTLESCDYDEGVYRQKLQEYTQTTSVEVAQRAVADALERQSQHAARVNRAESEEQALTRHYEAAAKLGVNDFEDTEDKVIEMFGKDAVKSVIGAVEDSHALVYYLGKNPRQAAPLAEMLRTNPLKGVMEMGRLADRIKVQPKTQVPQPDEPVTGADGAGGGALEQRLDKLREEVAAGKRPFSDLMKLKREANA